MERHRLLDRFVSVMDRIEETKPDAVAQGISPVGDEGYDEAIAEAERLAKEPDLEEAAQRRLRAEIDAHAVLTAEWREIQDLFREATGLRERYRELGERAAREDVPRSLLSEWPALQKLSDRFEDDARWALLDDRIQEYRQLRPDTFRDIEEELQRTRERRSVPELEDGRIAAMVGAELARLRDPGVAHAFDHRWWGAEPLLAGDRIRLQLSDDGPPREAVVRRPGWTGGCSLILSPAAAGTSWNSRACRRNRRLRESAPGAAARVRGLSRVRQRRTPVVANPALVSIRRGASHHGFDTSQGHAGARTQPLPS